MVHTDRRLVYAAAFLRATATGLAGVLLGVWLARVGLSPARIGYVVGSGLTGSALATLLVTLRGDRIGRRRALILLALLGAGGTAAVACAASPVVLAAAAFLGMVNGMGRDRGANLVLEQALLPGTVDDAGRTRAFAWYNVLQDSGHALGSLLAGLPELLRHWMPSAAAAGADPAMHGTAGSPAELLPLRITMLLGALLLLLPALCYLRISPAVEPPPAQARRPLSPESRRTIARLSALFALDSLGGGFLLTTLISFYFYKRFGVDESVLGLLFFGARVANALSHLLAARIARSIGLVNTMVFTHIPSSLLLATVPFAPTFPVAAALFLLREGLVEMDVPTRQSYVMAVVAPHERTVASGVTSLVRMAGWALPSFFAWLGMESVSDATPIYIGVALKISYDLLLWRSFRHLRPPEERTPA